MEEKPATAPTREPAAAPATALLSLPPIKLLDPRAEEKSLPFDEAYRIVQAFAIAPKSVSAFLRVSMVDREVWCG
jgi:hypothetical protein